MVTWNHSVIIIMNAAGSIDQLLNKYSEDVAVLLLILLYWCS